MTGEAGCPKAAKTVVNYAQWTIPELELAIDVCKAKGYCPGAQTAMNPTTAR